MTTTKSRHIFMGWPEFITGLLLWCIVGVILYTTNDMPMFEADKSPGPRFLPMIVCAVLALLTVLYWVESSIKRDKAIQFPRIRELWKPAAFFGLSLLLLLLWDFVGSVPAIMLVSFLELKLLEKYSLKRSLLMAAVLCGFTYVLFELVLDIQLPRGSLFY